jgi:hypothetical protein
MTEQLTGEAKLAVKSSVNTGLQEARRRRSKEAGDVPDSYALGQFRLCIP